MRRVSLLPNWVSIIFIALLPLGIEGSPAIAQQKVTIGGIIFARDTQYWQQLEKGMKDAAKKYDVELLVQANRRQLPVEAQVIEDFITRKVDVIVLPVLDKSASGTVLRTAKDAGIEIVNIDARLVDETISSHRVGLDQRALSGSVGKEMRKYIDGTLGGSATLGMVMVSPKDPNYNDRRFGMLDELKGANVTLAAEITGVTPEDGANGLEAILQKAPQTQVVFASNSGTITGAAAFARRAGAKVKLYGIDMSLELAGMLLDPSSSVEAVADQQPYLLGYNAIEAAARSKRGEKVDREILVPTKVYARSRPEEVQQYINFINSLAK